MEKLKKIIAKRLRSLSLQPSQKKPLPSLNKVFLALFPCLLLGMLLGTYLDLYFVSKGVYLFPKRLFPALFTINIGYNLVILPVITGITMLLYYQMPLCSKTGFLFLFGLCASVVEKLAEAFGFFTHTPAWKHVYSLIGYPIYFLFLYSIFLFFLDKISEK